MKREEIIAAIEKIRECPDCDERRADFARSIESFTANDQLRREQMNADFQRAFLFLFLLMLSDRRFSKAQREFLRPNRRSMLIWVCMIGVVVVQFLILTMGAQALGFGQAGKVFLLLLFIAEFFWVAWFVTKIQPRRGITELGMSYCCVVCKYDLSGLDSLLGDELWVGPVVCPECGQDYPAISE